jgi:hypothetical protein
VRQHEVGAAARRRQVDVTRDSSPRVASDTSSARPRSGADGDPEEILAIGRVQVGPMGRPHGGPTDAGRHLALTVAWSGPCRPGALPYPEIVPNRVRARIGTTLAIASLAILAPLAWAREPTVAMAKGADGDERPPIVELTLRPWVVRASGDVQAREGGTASEASGPLGLRDDAGVSGADVFPESELIVHLTRRDAIVAEVLVGSSSGSKQLTIDLPFDDGLFLAGERAETDASLATWALGYRRRVTETRLRERSLAVDAGVGFRRIGSGTRVRTARIADREDVVAAAVPYVELGARVTLSRRLSLLATLQGGPWSIRAFSEEPARGRFLSATLVGDLLLARNVSVQSGLLLFGTRIAFRGIERDGEDRADNRTELGLVGGMLGVSFRL